MVIKDRLFLMYIPLAAQFLVAAIFVAWTCHSLA
jgi:hypothetical protein